MIKGDIVIDICSSNDPEMRDKLVASSKAYWTSDFKSYELISDDIGRDFLRVFQSTVVDNEYDPGQSKWHADGDVILIYQKKFGEE